MLKFQSQQYLISTLQFLKFVQIFDKGCRKGPIPATHHRHIISHFYASHTKTCTIDSLRAQGPVVYRIYAVDGDAD